MLGQSHNPGWTATVDGESLGEPALVDGFANGWLITPDSASFQVEMRFAPQRRQPGHRRVAGQRAGLPGPGRPPAPHGGQRPVVTGRALLVRAGVPLRRRAAQPPHRLWTGVGVGLLGLVLAGPFVGIVIGLAAGAGARHETFRRYLLLGSPVALAVCALYVLYIQARWSPPPSFDWPIEMRRPHPIGWLAVLPWWPT